MYADRYLLSSKEKFTRSSDPRGLFHLPKPVPFESSKSTEYQERLREEYETYGTRNEGHYQIARDYLDWLIVGVWNDSMVRDDCYDADGNVCLYCDDEYYYPGYSAEAGALTYDIIVNSVEEDNDGKYCVTYESWYEDSLVDSGQAVMALKEARNGFRFWSVYQIQKQGTQSTDLLQDNGTTVDYSDTSTYRIVVPTQDEIDAIPDEIGRILSKTISDNL